MIYFQNNNSNNKRVVIIAGNLLLNIGKHRTQLKFLILRKILQIGFHARFHVHNHLNKLPSNNQSFSFLHYPIQKDETVQLYFSTINNVMANQ